MKISQITDLTYSFLIGTSIQSSIISYSFIIRKYFAKYYNAHYTTGSLLPLLATLLFGLTNMINVYLVYSLKFPRYISYGIGAILGSVLLFSNVFKIDPLETIFGIKIQNTLINGIVSIAIYSIIFGYFIGFINEIAFEKH
jgi:hypothetical protein